MGASTLSGFKGDKLIVVLDGAGAATFKGSKRNVVARFGGASVYTNTAANVNLTGMGSATVYGKPAQRKVSTDGMGKVSWR